MASSSPPARPQPQRRDSIRRDLDAYRAILRARVRAQTAYRASFATEVLGSVLVGLAELAELYAVFGNVTVLGGLRLREALLVFALANLSWSMADLAVGHADGLPTYIRTGTLDAFYLRPLPVLGQLVTHDVSLRRVGRGAVALVVLTVALRWVDPTWTPLLVVQLVVAVLAGALIFMALFIAAAGLQFFLIDAAELTNAFTYGSAYAAAQPALVLPNPMRVFFTFVVPATFAAYLPVVVMLDLPGGDVLAPRLGWCSPLAALAAWAVAMGLWRVGMRHYQGAGG